MTRSRPPERREPVYEPLKIQTTSRMASKRKTQKRNTKNKKTLMTIPQLRSAFEHLDHKAMQLKGKDKETQVQEFQAAWKAVFSRDVSPKAVEAYLAVKHAERSSGSKKRSTRRKSRANQSGGAAPLAGAPLDFQTRPGIDGVSGSFPAYVDKGLSFYDTVNQHARMADCGVKDFSPKIPAGMGSNQAGGSAVRDFASALTFKPFESTVPSSVYQDVRSAYLGAPLPPSPAVEDHTWKFK